MYVESEPGKLLEHVQVLFTTGTAVGLSDRDLLERFLQHGPESGEAAFTALVQRHGPMVLRVCNKALRDPHAADDAFQATFLVLARQARSIRGRDSLASWLFGVATRAAARIRMMEARRQRYERRSAIVRANDDTVGPDSSGHWPELHSEIALLPEKYRVPIVLCYLEGLTHEQAAAQLGWPLGTVKTRLARARDQLRTRLERRGWSSTLLISTEYLRPWNVTAVPRLLLDSTTQAAIRFVSGAGAGEFISTTVLAISQGVERAMLINKLRLVAIMLTSVAALGLGAMVLARQAPGKQPADGQPGPVSAVANGSARPKILRLSGSTSHDPRTIVRVQLPFDCLVERVMVELGSRVRKGDPLLEVRSTVLAEAKSTYEAAVSQWVRDKKILDYKTPLANGNNIPRKELIEAENDEAQSRLRMKLALDKLLVYGLTNAEIQDAKNQEGVQKARMILRSTIDGIVVQRNVVLGNYYAAEDALLMIARDDVLSVFAKIDPRDADRIEVGQQISVSFPFNDRTVNAKVEFISREAEPETGKLIIRTTIPNPDHRWKPGMFVRFDVELGPAAQSLKFADGPTSEKAGRTLEARLNDVERELERLLDEKGGSSSNAEILGRLSELEKKLDRALKLGTGK